MSVMSRFRPVARKIASFINNRWSFIALPIVFAVLSALVLALVLVPLLRPYWVSMQSMMVSGQETADTPRNLLDMASQREGAAEESPHIDTIPLSELVLPLPGDQYGQLTIEGTAVDAPVFYRDSEQELNDGIGTYDGAWMPGFGRTVLMAGHTGTWLYDLGSAKIGAIITIETSYGSYEYEIVDTAVRHHEDTTAYDFDRPDENLILYTCYPFHTIGLTPERYFVYADYRSGPVVDSDS